MAWKGDHLVNCHEGFVFFKIISYSEFLSVQYIDLQIFVGGKEKKLEQTNVYLAPLLEGEAEGQVRLPVMDWQRSSQRGFAFLRSLVSCRLIINHRAQENGQEEETQAACNSSVASANSSLYRRAFVSLGSVRGGSEALSWRRVGLHPGLPDPMFSVFRGGRENPIPCCSFGIHKAARMQRNEDRICCSTQVNIDVLVRRSAAGEADAATTKASINHSFNTAAVIRFIAGARPFQNGYFCC